ncbi:MAG: hypothetical protein ABIP35_06335 [Ginsengibacter sp.]
MQNTKNKAVQSLLEGRSPANWVSWLFDIQSQLIAYNHLDGHSDEGAKEFSSRFWELKNFFVELENEKK